jgi:hypothetical protein
MKQTRAPECPKMYSNSRRWSLALMGIRVVLHGERHAVAGIELQLVAERAGQTAHALGHLAVAGNGLTAASQGRALPMAPHRLDEKLGQVHRWLARSHLIMSTRT